MNANQQLSHVVNLLRTWRAGLAPADQVLSSYLARNRELGPRPRRIIGDTFFAFLRLMRRIDRALDSALEDCPIREDIGRASAFPCDLPPNDRVWAMPKSQPPRRSPADDWIDVARAALAANAVEPGRLKDCVPLLVSTWPVKSRRHGPEWLERTLSRAHEWMVDYAGGTTPMKLALRASMPDWLWAQVGYGLAPKELPDFADSLVQPASPVIRVPGGPEALAKAREALAAAGVEATPGQLAKAALVLSGRLPRGGVPGLAEGEFEYQDEGSQVLVELLAPAPGQTVIDACAGGGGKTLQLAGCLGGGTGLHAHEPVADRREALQKRLQRAGVEGVVLLDGPGAAPPADLVLVDAPCSGLGTVRRSPDLKWRLTPDLLTQRIRLQREILAAWAPAVRRGGRLAYATCSLLPEENIQQVRWFLEQDRSFELDLPSQETIERGLATREGCVQLYPHRHGCDGFFLAVLKRG